MPREHNINTWGDYNTWIIYKSNWTLAQDDANGNEEEDESTLLMQRFIIIAAIK